MRAANERRDELRRVWEQASGCTRCPELVRTRHTVVFGSGNADAALMFVGEAPGANEDRRGLPFVGQAGSLLDRLLAGIGLTREDVFVANVLKCRPPGNRDPLPREIENCREYLMRQLELIEPALVCTLGNFATKLLRADPGTGITRLHGRVEERVIGPRAVRLYPLLHPAAALYTPRMLATLEADFERIPELLSLPALEQPPRREVAGEPAAWRAAAAAAADPSGHERALGTPDGHTEPATSRGELRPAPAAGSRGESSAGASGRSAEEGTRAEPSPDDPARDRHADPSSPAAAAGDAAAAPPAAESDPPPGQLGLF